MCNITEKVEIEIERLLLLSLIITIIIILWAHCKKLIFLVNKNENLLNYFGEVFIICKTY